MAARSPLQEIKVNTNSDHLTPEERGHYDNCIRKAKNDIQKDNLYSAWNGYKRAYGIFQSEKVASKITKLEKHMTTYKLWPEDKAQSGPAEVVVKTVTHTREKVEKQTTSSQDKTAGGDISDVVTLYNDLIHKAKACLQNDEVYQAFLCYQRAQELHPTEKMERKIAKTKVYLKENNLYPTGDTEGSASMEVTPAGETGPDSSEMETSGNQEQTSGQAEGADSVRPGPSEDGSHSDTMEVFRTSVKEAKELLKAGQFYEALDLYKKANNLVPGEEVQKRIRKVQNYIHDNDIQRGPSEGSESLVKPVHVEQPEETAPDSSEMETSGNQEQTSGQAKEADSVRSGPSEDRSHSDTVEVFRTSVKDAKELLKAGQFYEALDLYKKANNLVPGEEVQKRIRKVQNYIRDNDIQRGPREGSESLVKPVHVEQPERALKTPHKKVLGGKIEDRSSQSVAELSSASPEVNEDKFRELYQKARTCMEEDRYKEALNYYNKANTIIPSEKVQRRIAKLQEHLADEESAANSSQMEEEGSDDMKHVGNGFYLFKDMYSSLYAHQTQGILWMWRLYQQKKGGILGDDMGLGKTIQVIGFLSGMFDAEKIKAVLIVLPVAVIVNWEREFEKWAPGLRLDFFRGPSMSAREKAMQKVSRKGGVMLTSYGMLQRPQNTALLAEVNGREFVWDYVILDEGHKIKNPSNKCSKGVHSLPARNRLILTGTPIQNNLKEMWTLFDWTHQGSLLGTSKTFSMQFEQPITRARQKDATVGEHRLGQEMANSLRTLIQPFFMRRTKAEVSRGEKLRCKREKEGGEEEGSAHMPTMTRKNDLICWVYLSDTQQRIYEDFSSQDDVKELLNSSRSPLTALNQLKKICDHPRLMTTKQCLALGLHMDDGLHQMETIDEETSNESAVARIKHIPDHILVDESGKMVFLVQLLDNLKAQGHRCLVFSQSLKMLDIIQKVMGARGHKIARLDGTIRHLYEREDIINRFSKDRSYSLFLLTTQVGGVGLTLTAADRVVIFDPSWNPATDAQAVDRAFRIGQDKNVVIYRLITCGSVEEKIYRRQIFKESITKQTTGDSNNPFRYFSRQELHEIFVLDNPRHSNTQVQLNSLHGGQRKTDTNLDEHIAFLHTLDVFGLSDHDLMFNKEAAYHSDEEHEEGNDYIQNRVEQANRLIALEAEENVQQTQQTGKYAAPEVFAEKSERPPRNTGMFNYPVKSPPSPDVIEVDNDSGEESLNKTMGDMSIMVKHSPRSPTPSHSSEESSDEDDVVAVETNNPRSRPGHSSYGSPQVSSHPQVSPGIHGNDAEARHFQLMSEEDQIKMAMQMSIVEARETEEKILAQIQKESDKKPGTMTDIVSGEEDIDDRDSLKVPAVSEEAIDIVSEKTGDLSVNVGDDKDGLKASVGNELIHRDSPTGKGHSTLSDQDEKIGQDEMTNKEESNIEMETDNYTSSNNVTHVDQSATDESSSDSFKSVEEKTAEDSSVISKKNDAEDNVTVMSKSVIKNGAETEVLDEGEKLEDDNESKSEISATEVHHGVQVSFESVGATGEDLGVSNGNEAGDSNHEDHTHDAEAVDTFSGSDEELSDQFVEDKGAQVSFGSSDSDLDISVQKKHKRDNSMFQDMSSEGEDVDSEDDLPAIHPVKRKNHKKNVIDSDSSEGESETETRSNIESETNGEPKNESRGHHVTVAVSCSDEGMEVGDDGLNSSKGAVHAIFQESEGSGDDEMAESENNNTASDDGEAVDTFSGSDEAPSDQLVEDKGAQRTQQEMMSPPRGAGGMASAINKRALTPRDTPVSNKRRRSVNVGLTPHKVLHVAEVMSPRPVVVQEELVFSPRGNEPQVATRTKEDWFSGEGELAYDAFKEQVESSSNIANSTRMFDATASPGISQPTALVASSEKRSSTSFPVAFTHLLGDGIQHTVSLDMIVEQSTEDEESKEESEEESEEEEEEELSPEDLERYTHCVMESRKHYKSGDLQNALALVKQALELCADEEQVRKYALKLQRKLAESLQA